MSFSALAFLLATGVPETTEVVFRYRPTSPARSVHVAGSFNGWNSSANPMAKADDGYWKKSIALPFGRHLYKFVVDGQNWFFDPKATANEDDGQGGLNSVIVVFPASYKLPARTGDGAITTDVLKHLTEVPMRNVDRGLLTLTIRARPRDVQKVEVEANRKTHPASLIRTDEIFAYYQARIPWSERLRTDYRFILTDGDKRVTFGSNGAHADAKPFSTSAAEIRPLQVPTWVESSVFYQIFPDRFKNGSTANDPADIVPWGGEPTWFNRFGGDIAGIRSRIPYLTELGVDAIYFNPVFASPSNHRYDASDFRKIDPQLGTNAEFRALTEELKRAGIRTVMDFVFNHSAVTFRPFLDLRERGEASKYRDWYFIRSFPIRVADPPNYEAWFGFPSMPKINVLNPETRDYMLSLVDFWKANAEFHGLRLDVANEVPQEFWRLLRTQLKAKHPDTWIVGEVWGDGSPWLTGDQWDSVMNYQFRDACLRFIAEGTMTATQFADRLMSVHHSYAPQVSRNMMNLLSSHDTPRFLTMARGDRRLAKLGASVQFTWIGAPSIYYGEELGMEGGRDPENRRGMRWDLVNSENSMLNHYRRLIQIRSQSKALQSGDVSILNSNDASRTMTFARSIDQECAVVSVNRSESTQTISFRIPSGVPFASANRMGFVDTLSGRRFTVSGGNVTFQLAPFEAAILLPATSSNLLFAEGLTRGQTGGIDRTLALSN